MLERLAIPAGAGILSCLLALYLTPLVRGAALRFGVLDLPTTPLKTHRDPVPYLGGIAVYLAFILALSLVFEFGPQLLGLLLGGTMMAMLGLFDDLRVLPPALKLMGQGLAAWVMIKSHIMIQLQVLPEGVAMVLTALWLVGITNAVNIIDVSDGLAAGTSAVALFALAGVACINGNTTIAAATLALCGALLGFLRYNAAPARIYLGDTGSLFIGFMLAALSMVGAYTQTSLAGAAAPLAILCVPLLDITLVSLARLRQGKSPLQGSPDHFAIRLKARGWSANRVAGAAASLSGIGALVASGLIVLPQNLALGTLACAVALFFGILTWLWNVPPPKPRQTDVD